MTLQQLRAARCGSLHAAGLLSYSRQPQAHPQPGQRSRPTFGLLAASQQGSLEGGQVLQGIPVNCCALSRLRRTLWLPALRFVPAICQAAAAAVLLAVSSQRWRSLLLLLLPLLVWSG